MGKTVQKHLTSKGSIALRAGRANARRCFGRYVARGVHMKYSFFLIFFVLVGCSSTDNENSKFSKMKHVYGNTYLDSEGKYHQKLSSVEQNRVLKALKKRDEKYNLPSKSEYNTCLELIDLLKNRGIEILSIKEKEVEIKVKHNVTSTYGFPTASCIKPNAT
ncbi:hypothetical protein [Shewanella sedimentimangrovi]|uniref:Lipoprotein n=1 Tax=Shewanella sedimentimangrovi TaxID=2814293 RepID=A0ABX7R7D2_9GAMM|nr:hypothetical protein [Shewanella sedimentimangrovi]QSX38660.1 hypothetical protein JYB85_07575 [Shewanella sedimentimangrovi]